MHECEQNIRDILSKSRVPSIGVAVEDCRGLTFTMHVTNARAKKTIIHLSIIHNCDRRLNTPMLINFFFNSPEIYKTFYISFLFFNRGRLLNHLLEWVLSQLSLPFHNLLLLGRFFRYFLWNTIVCRKPRICNFRYLLLWRSDSRISGILGFIN
ncbi:unnamed protein product [Meloidogyne enterolobii]|uniref:Uncharacterized protein n=1 Tax=Meloidogyne enterolobii TaxID=390850 RepID=A0ACB1B6A1_MELEN